MPAFVSFRSSFAEQSFAVCLKSSATKNSGTSFHTLFGVKNDGRDRQWSRITWQC